MALDVEKYRNRLIEERDRLFKELKIEAESEIPESGTDRTEITAADAPAISEAVDVQATVADMKTHRLERVLAALQSIDDGTYGICVNCGKPIDPRRLDADPAAMTCMECLPPEEANFKAPNM